MTNQRSLGLFGALVLLLAVACGDGAASDQPASIGPTTTEERAAAPFTRVSVAGAISVTVRQKSGAPERIEVTAPAGVHERVRTTVSDGTIRVAVAREVPEGTAVLLVVPRLTAIDAVDGAAVTVVGELDLPVFEASAESGATIVATDVIGFANSGGAWELRAADGATIDLVEIIVASVVVEASGRSRIAVEALTSVLGTVEAGATLEVAGAPARVDVSGGGFVRAEPAEPTATSGGAVAARPDELTRAPLPALESASVAFDEDRFNASAGTFPALTDPEVVPAADARWLDDDTLVLGATQNGEARAYPIFMLQFHHVANDVLGRKPYLVTF